MEINITELVYLIARLTGFEREIVWDMTKPDGQPRHCLDASKAEQEFGVKSMFGFEEGLK